MAEVHTGIHAAALAARRLLDFDLVAHLSLEDLHNLFPNPQVSYYKEFPGLRVPSRWSPSRRFQDFSNEFIRDWLVPQKSGANATAALKDLQKRVDRFGPIQGWKSARRFGSHDSGPLPPYTTPQMLARTTPGFFHKSGKSRITGFEAISFGAELKCEAFFFSDHNHGRPTRRNLRGALQDFLPAG